MTQDTIENDKTSREQINGIFLLSPNEDLQKKAAALQGSPIRQNQFQQLNSANRQPGTNCK